MLEKYNLVWIITDYDIDVVRLPKFGEEMMKRSFIHIIVYSVIISFTIYDEAGNAIINMLATFVLMDRDSRKRSACSRAKDIAPYGAEFSKVDSWTKVSDLKRIN